YTSLYPLLFLFFFSSRRRHTRFSRDWSSDVCSSDLARGAELRVHRLHHEVQDDAAQPGRRSAVQAVRLVLPVPAQGDARRPGTRSEESRVGKECRSRWSQYHEKQRKDEGREEVDTEV